MTEDPKTQKSFVPSESNEETRRYWDRLDAKFAVSSPAPPASSTPREPAPARTWPATPSAAPLPSAAASSAPPHSPPSRLIADAFDALLALEDGQPGAKPVRLTIGDGNQPAAAAPAITDAVIEDVVRRVIARLGPDAVRAVVTDVVSEISERLVKEEIERIRNQNV